jgi:hypothetical protein
MASGLIGIPDFPRVEAQLQLDVNGVLPPSRSADCSVRTCQGGIRWGTRGAVTPTVKQIRNFLGNPVYPPGHPSAGKPAGLTMIQARDAYRHWGLTAERVLTFDEAWAALKAGKFVHIAVDYGWIGANAPQLCGQFGLNAAHGVGVYGVEKVLRSSTAPEWTCWLDPLNDKRRKRLAKQIVMAKKAEVKAAMLAVGWIGAVAVTRKP